MVKTWLSLGLVLLLLNGCTESGSLEVIDERDEKHFNRGQVKLGEQRYDEALGAFLKVIEKRREAPESHLEAGRLYQDYLGDPVAAIYHYRKYLEYEPDSQQAPLVRQMIESAKKDFARQLPGKPYDDEIERLDLLEIIESVRAENLELKQQLAAARIRSEQLEGATVAPPRFDWSQDPSRSNAAAARQADGTPPARTTERGTTTQAQAPPASGTRLYTVQEGDTLSRISSQFYGTSARWQDIFNANRDILDSPNALRVGQELKIPVE